MRTPVSQLADPQQLRRRAYAIVAARPSRATQARRERDVFVDGLVRVERDALKDHCDVALLRRDVLDGTAVKEDAATRWRVQPGDHVERRCLAAARRAQQDDEFLVNDLEVERIDHGGL